MGKENSPWLLVSVVGIVAVLAVFLLLQQATLQQTSSSNKNLGGFAYLENDVIAGFASPWDAYAGSPSKPYFTVTTAASGANTIVSINITKGTRVSKQYTYKSIYYYNGTGNWTAYNITNSQDWVANATNTTITITTPSLPKEAVVIAYICKKYGADPTWYCGNTDVPADTLWTIQNFTIGTTTPITCTTGDKKCFGTQIVTCTAGVWSTPAPCPSGQTCTGVEPTATCSAAPPTCTTGAKKCYGAQLQTCTAGVWSTPVICPSGQTCTGLEPNSLCASPIICEANIEQQCLVNMAQKCNSAGTGWNNIENCATTGKVCSYDGATASCITPTICTAGRQRCNTTGTPAVNIIEQCNITGLSWFTNTTCTAPNTVCNTTTPTAYTCIPPPAGSCSAWGGFCNTAAPSDPSYPGGFVNNLSATGCTGSCYKCNTTDGYDARGNSPAQICYKSSSLCENNTRQFCTAGSSPGTFVTTSQNRCLNANYPYCRTCAVGEVSMGSNGNYQCLQPNSVSLEVIYPISGLYQQTMELFARCSATNGVSALWYSFDNANTKYPLIQGNYQTSISLPNGNYVLTVACNDTTSKLNSTTRSITINNQATGLCPLVPSTQTCLQDQQTLMKANKNNSLHCYPYGGGYCWQCSPGNFYFPNSGLCLTQCDPTEDGTTRCEELTTGVYYNTTCHLVTIAYPIGATYIWDISPLNKQCIPSTCTQGQTKCSGAQIQNCPVTGGSWGTATSCPQGAGYACTGPTGTATCTLIPDSTLPVITINKPTPTVVANGGGPTTIKVNVGCTDNVGVKSIQYKINDTVSPDTLYPITNNVDYNHGNDLANGTYNITIYCKDIADNQQITSLIFTVGTLPGSCTNNEKRCNPAALTNNQTCVAGAWSGTTACANGCNTADGTCNSAAGTVANPSYNPVAGSYSSPQSVVISTTTAGATIYYTIDGMANVNVPTICGDPAIAPTQKYTAAVPIDVTSAIKAKACKTGMTTSAQIKAAYTISCPATVCDNLNENDNVCDADTLYTCTLVSGCLTPSNGIDCSLDGAWCDRYPVAHCNYM